MKLFCIFIAVRCGHVIISNKFKQLLPQWAWLLINELFCLVVIGYEREYIKLLTDLENQKMGEI